MKLCSVRKLPNQNMAVALGTFDGLHLGHRAILSRLKEEAKTEDLCTMVYTFSNLPQNLFGKDIGNLFSEAEKAEIFAKTGVDFLVMEEFNLEIADMPPEKFVDFLADTLRAKVVVAGFNYSFGKGGVGNAKLLTEYGRKRGIRVVIQEPVLLDGQPISSTRIRNALLTGEMEEAERLLGRPYSFLSVVEHGKRLGRTIGFPTVNFYPDPDKLCPRHGVYIAIGEYGGWEYPAITNIGVRPTVDDGTRLNIESHFIGFWKEIYGEQVTVYLKTWLRGEQKFPSVEALSQQLGRDIKSAQQYLEERGIRLEKRTSP